MIFFLCLLLCLPAFASDKEQVFLFSGASIREESRALANIPMNMLARKLRRHGKVVHHIEYQNHFGISREQMLDSAKKNLLAKINPEMKFTIIAHSMGHHVALAAVLELGIKNQVKYLIGLAGSAKGAEKVPSYCQKYLEKNCPAIKGMILGKKDYFLDDYFKKHEKSLLSLKLCSIVAKNDPRVSDPWLSSFFEHGKNFILPAAFHVNLPMLPRTMKLMQEHCGL